MVQQADTKDEFPAESIKRLSEEGYLGLPIPRKFGGRGLSELGYGLVIEELSRVCAAHATIVGAHTGLCEVPIWLFGRDEQKRRLLPALTSGSKLGAFALTEPQAGSDVAGLRTKAERDGDEYVLRGSKIFVTNGDRADVVICFARMSNATGIGAFIVEKGFPGFGVGKVNRKMGIRASSTAELIFDGCRVPEANILGHEGDGMDVALTALDGGRVILAAGSLGSAERALEVALGQVKERVREGRSVGESVLWMLADMAMEVHAARYVTCNTLVEVDRYFDMIAKGESIPTGVREKLSRDAAMAKAYVSEVASRAIERSLQICGLSGLVEGSWVEKAFRDSMVAEIYEGTNEIQRLVVAKDLLGRGGL